ncbi:MAG: vitamin K epoxide reductase family protein [Proteobacteria bacterium]|nr:vitamin K epoxide reductase family protein [Pseudomonadota bacterium]
MTMPFVNPRLVALLLAVISAAAMLYVGLYQSRAVNRLWCPILEGSCQAVADASFARPFGIPDGYIGTALYFLIGLLLLGPVESLWIWIPLLVLSALAAVANALGVFDMIKLGSFCVYCLATTLASPFLLWSVWSLRS